MGRQEAMYGEPEYYDDEPQAASPPAAPAARHDRPAPGAGEPEEQGILTEQEFQAKKKQILDL